MTDPLQAAEAHQVSGPFAADPMSPSEAQLGVHPGRPVGAARHDMHGADLVEEMGVVHVTGTRRAAPPLVEPADARRVRLTAGCSSPTRPGVNVLVAAMDGILVTDDLLASPRRL